MSKKMSDKNVNIHLFLWKHFSVFYKVNTILHLYCIVKL